MNSRAKWLAMQAAVLAELKEMGRELEDEARRLAPKGDPAQDPDPAVSLSESFETDVSAQPGRVFVIVRNTAPYALYQHEGYYRHPRGGQRKFLEEPAKRQMRTLEGRLAAAARRAA